MNVGFDACYGEEHAAAVPFLFDKDVSSHSTPRRADDAAVFERLLFDVWAWFFSSFLHTHSASMENLTDFFSFFFVSLLSQGNQ